MKKNVPITVARGDGIGPEIMASALSIMKASGASLRIEEIEVGERVYLGGFTSGIRPEAWDTLRSTKVLLKSPITTPQGGGMKSLNVTMRKALGLYANVRPCQSYSPVVRTKHPILDLVIIRENEEDLYAGIEYRQTDEVYQTLKLVTRPGCERIHRYAFEYARLNGRKKVACFSKDNIMKFTDGIFHEVFDEIAREYPEISTEHHIVDIGAARLADTPEQFDVIVMPNLYGDILSDVAAQIAGSVGLAGSANIGDSCALFEAIHGSAPTIAGQGIANPTGLLIASTMMLIHIGQPKIAELIHNAVLKTLEDGIHSVDVFRDGQSKKLVGTEEFSSSVISRLGAIPKVLKPVSYSEREPSVNPHPRLPARQKSVKKLLGVDVYLHFDERNPQAVALQLQRLTSSPLAVSMISNRGVKVWPDGFPEVTCADHWRCRFLARSEGDSVSPIDIVRLLGDVVELGLDYIKTENLYTFDGKLGFSLSQGQ